MKSSVSLSDQPVILEKPAVWSHVFLWVIMLITGSAIIWAYFAKIEQTVPAVGELEYSDGAREIQAPTTGAVVRLHVENGDRVAKNQPLLTFSPTNSSADLRSIEQLQTTLEGENQFYRGILQGQSQGQAPAELVDLVRERQARIGENQALQALLNELYLNRGVASGFSSSLASLVANYRAEYQSRVRAGESQVRELEKQLEQALQAEQAARQQLEIAENQLAFSENQLANAQQQLQFSDSQQALAEEQLTKSDSVLDASEQILQRLEEGVNEGAIAELQRDRQQQEVLRSQNDVLRQQDQIVSRQGEINRLQGEVNSREGEINSRRGEIARIQSEIRNQQVEQQRIEAAISRAEEQLQNNKDSWARELNTRIVENEKQIASADSQLGRSRLANEKQLSELDAQLEKLEEQRDTQVLRAPAAGIVSDLVPTTKDQASLELGDDEICQYITNAVLKPGDPGLKRCEEAYYEAQQTEELLKVLDDEEGLQAVAYVQNSNVALVLNALRLKREKLEPLNGQEVAGEVIECTPQKDCFCPKSEAAWEELGLTEDDCVKVELNIDAFPAGEFGTVVGELKWISQDAIPPDELRQYYSFEAKIQLEKDYFVLDEEQDIRIALQSGMAVNSKINIGKRTVLQLMFSRFTGTFNSMTNVR
ncbi:MAG: chromosome partitioning protein ParA [Microcoleaceae cyanobacterium]